MRKSAIFALLVAPIISCGVLAQQRVTTVVFQVRDAATNQALDADVSVDGDPVVSEFKVSPEAESRILMDVTASAGTGYHTRTFTVFLEAVNQPRVIYRIYLAPRPSEKTHNRATVARGAQFLNARDADRALALLEAVSEETNANTKASQFGVYLRFNLWRAYLLSCTLRFVDYCEVAVNFGNAMLVQQQSHPEYYSAENITRDELDRGVRSLADAMLRLTYLRAKWDLNRRRPDEALGSLAIVTQAQQDDPATLSRLQISSSDVDYLVRKARTENISEIDRAGVQPGG